LTKCKVIRRNNPNTDTATGFWGIYMWNQEWRHSLRMTVGGGLVG
jgi:hypothetical protein